MWKYLQNPLQLLFPFPPRRLPIHKRLTLIPPFPLECMLRRDQPADVRCELRVGLGGLVHDVSEGRGPCCYDGGV